MSRLNDLLALAQELDSGRDADEHPMFNLNSRAIGSGFSAEEYREAVAAAVEEGHITVKPDCGPKGAGVFKLNRK